MNIRAMTNDDLLAYKHLCSICYRYPDTNEPQPLDDEALHMRMGAFSEDGRLLSAMMQIPYSVRFCGKDVPMVGIGGVATDPTARRGGAIRAMFEEGLPRLYQEGQILSALYPFSFQFYGKFGYTWAEMWKKRAIRVRDLRADLQAADEIVRVLPGEDDQGMRTIYEAYIADKHLAIHRSEWAWKELRQGMPWEALKHAYVFKVGGQAVSYWIGKFAKGKDGELLVILDMAWTCPRGRDAIFAMLRGMNELDLVEMRCQSGFDPRRLVAEAYDVSERGSTPGMVRLVNVEKALGLLPAPVVSGRVTIEVTDGQIPQNNGLFTVEGDGKALWVYRAEDEAPDLRCGIGSLSALVVGRDSLGDAVENGTAELLREDHHQFAELLFVRRGLHLNQDF